MPEVKLSAVAPVPLPMVIVLAMALPMLIVPVPESISTEVELVSLPMTMVLAASPVPRLIVSAEVSSPMAMVPVVPELIVKEERAAEENVTVPEPV